MKAVFSGRLVPVLLIVLIIAAGCIPFSSDLLLPQTPEPTLAPAQPRFIARSTLPLQEIWRKNLNPDVGQTGWATASSKFMLARPEVLYVVNHEPNAEDARWSWPILALDPQTGNQKWKTEPFNLIDSFSASPSMLVVASTYGIKAYGAVNGKEKWASDQHPPDHEGYTVSLDDLVLNFIASKGPDDLYTKIDPKTGKVGNFQKSEHVLTKIDSQYRYTWYPLDTLWLEDIKTTCEPQADRLALFRKRSVKSI